jgi:hypothetical protein
MSTVHVAVVAITVLANAAVAVADLTRARFVLATSAEVGVPESWLPLLAALKAAGAAGLLIGVLALPCLAVAAAAGLVAFFVGAVAAHVRARVFHTIGFPVAFLTLAAASLALSLANADSNPVVTL